MDDREASASAADWLGFLAMCLGMFMAILDIQIVASSLPEIQAGLGIPLDDLSWIQTAYLIAEIIAIPLTGWLTGLLTLRRLYLGAVVAFTLASAGCAASGSLAVLLGFRVVQGFCGGILVPATFTAVFVLFPERLHARATGIGGLCAMLAPVLGPTLGGTITEMWSWPWLFLINIGPGGLAAAVAAASLRPAMAESAALERLDLASLVLFATALAALELGLKEAPKSGWLEPYPLGLWLVCLAAAGVATLRTLGRARPLIDLRLLGERDFAASCFCSFVVGGALYGSVYLLPLFLGYVRHHSALETGRIMFVTGAAQFCVLPLAVALVQKMGPVKVAAAGFLFLAAGLLGDGFTTAGTDFAGLFWPQALRGAGTMLCLLPTTAVALEGRGGAELAQASGLYNLSRNLGGAVWIALADTILETRGPLHAADLVARLQAGDPGAARLVGLPVALFHGQPMAADAATRQIVQPLVERAASVASFNEAWLALGAFTALSLLALPLLRRR